MCISSEDRIVAVIASRASGPGWSNTPLWVVVKDQNGKLREVCFQPDEQSPDVRLLYSIAEQTHRTMVAAVELMVADQNKCKKSG